MRRRARTTFLLLCSLAGLLLVQPVGASEAPVAGEHKLEAAFLYQFTKFITWPQSPERAARASFVISVVGESPILQFLKEIAGSRKVEGKPITVLNPESAAELQPSDIVFIASGEAEVAAEVLKKTHGLPTLTVGASALLARAGVMINFFPESNHIKFEINRHAIEERFQVSSQLMKLARIRE